MSENNDWVRILESDILTKIINGFSESEKERLHFSTVDKMTSEPEFPLVKLDTTGLAERGQTLEGNTINAVEVTIQVDVLSTDGQLETRDIAWKAVNALKQYGFSFTGLPLSTNEGEVYRSTFRATRIIGNADKFIKLHTTK